MINFNDVIDYYSYFYRKKYSKKDTVKLNKATVSVVNKFISELDNLYNINCIGQSFLFRYFLFQFMSLESMNISSLNKKIRLNMIVGKPAIKRYIERDKEFDWLLDTKNDYVIKYSIRKYDLFKDKNKEYHNNYEEQIKRLFYNTAKGLLFCTTNTTMYNKHHSCCLTCNNRKECKELQKVNYPKIYDRRNY